MRGPGIEPGSVAWEATILPLNHTRFFVRTTTAYHPKKSRMRRQKEPPSETAACRPAESRITITRSPGFATSYFSRSSASTPRDVERSEEHTSELQSQSNLVC